MTEKPKRPTGLRKAANSPTNRAKVSNGKRLFLDGVPVDGRSALARRFRDLIEELSDQLGGEPMPGQAILVRNIAAMATLNEFDQAKIAAGQPIDEELFLSRVRVIGVQLQRLGLNAAARDAALDARTIDGHAAAVRGAD